MIFTVCNLYVFHFTVFLLVFVFFLMLTFNQALQKDQNLQRHQNLQKNLPKKLADDAETLQVRLLITSTNGIFSAML